MNMFTLFIYDFPACTQLSPISLINQLVNPTVISYPVQLEQLKKNSQYRD